MKLQKEQLNVQQAIAEIMVHADATEAYRMLVSEDRVTKQVAYALRKELKRRGYDIEES